MVLIDCPSTILCILLIPCRVSKYNQRDLDKVKEKVKGAKDKVVDTVKEGVSSSTSTNNEEERKFEEGVAGRVW